MPPLEASKLHQTISRNAPLVARYSLHTERTQKQRSSRKLFVPPAANGDKNKWRQKRNILNGMNF